MEERMECIKNLKQLKSNMSNDEIVDYINDLIDTLEDDSVEEVIFSFNELVVKYCFNLIETSKVRLENYSSLNTTEKLILAKGKNILDKLLYLIWIDSNAFCDSVSTWYNIENIPYSLHSIDEICQYISLFCDEARKSLS